MSEAKERVLLHLQLLLVSYLEEQQSKITDTKSVFEASQKCQRQCLDPEESEWR